MASSLAKTKSHHRQTPQSSSASSSSIITVQRAASVSPRNGTRSNVPTFRSQSPNERNLAPAKYSGRTISPDTKKRSSAVYHRPDSAQGVREGVGNLNRWSQSTTSSRSSATYNRRSSFSKRLSGSFGSFGGNSNPQASSNALNKAHTTSTHTQQALAAKPALVQPPPDLLPLVTSSSLSRTADSAETPLTAATSTPTTIELLSASTSTSGDLDYFGEHYKGNLLSSEISTAASAPLLIAVPSFATKPISQAYFFQSSGSESSQRPIATDAAASSYYVRSTSRPNHSEKYQLSHRRYSRSRGSRKGSFGTEGESSTSSVRSARARSSRRKTSAMLSKALQKANHAVLLDNAQNFEGAMEAYADACDLLYQVMSRSSTDEDRGKLENVRKNYTNRINELRNIDISYQSADGKALPEPPRERDSQDQDTMSPVTDDDNENTALDRSAASDRINSGPRNMNHGGHPQISHPYIPPRRQSLLPVSYRVEDKILHASEMAQSLLPPAFKVEDKILQASEAAQEEQEKLNHVRAKSIRSDHLADNLVELEASPYNQHVPPPRSPWRSLSPAPPAELSASPPKDSVSHIPDKTPNHSKHLRQDTAESTSWLDTIDESGGSSSESVHSRSSSIGLRRKRIRAPSGATEAEFDAALDAAVEAAYDDGFEPDDDDYDQYGRGEFVSEARRNVDMAKEMVRQAEREEAILIAKDREKRRLQERLAKRDSLEIEYGDDEADEEERMLEEMTRDYIMDDSEYELQSKSALPRQSDSSSFSGQTWGSSIGSNPTSAGTSFSTVAGKPMIPSLIAQMRPSSPPSFPPPLGALPPPPANSLGNANFRFPSGATSTTPGQLSKSSLGVRERRLSGINVKKLKIETNTKAGSTEDTSVFKNPLSSTSSTAISAQPAMEPPRSTLASEESSQKLSNPAFSPLTTALETSNHNDLLLSSGSISTEAGANVIPITSALTKVTSIESEKSAQSIPSSPNRFVSKGLGLRKNFSSSSLKTKGLAAPTQDAIDVSPASSTSTQRKVPLTAVPIPPSSVGTNFVIDRVPTDGIYLFESDIHSPVTPGSPNSLVTNAPLPLEFCPDLPLLRPFWLLRCIYQTIAHPRGAYISTKLFVPSSIWKVKNVKLKNIDEKVASCDLLSAALLKLAKVDTLDADAVLREMQFLENVMDQAQANLAKKLGNDVGVVGMSSLFKGPSTVEEAVSTSESLASKGITTNNKSYLSSWRKLRSKNSVGPNVTPVLTNTSKETSKDGVVMDSLPMTSIADPKFPKRDLGRIQYHGPNSNYMAALARLCDAVQILDQIARQVEDPGLKHSSQTHVGLELGMRHAAEFFGFFVCRFVLGDVSMMLDKFIKRGSEWVLA